MSHPLRFRRHPGRRIVPHRVCAMCGTRRPIEEMAWFQPPDGRDPAVYCARGPGDCHPFIPGVRLFCFRCKKRFTEGGWIRFHVRGQRMPDAICDACIEHQRDRLLPDERLAPTPWAQTPAR